MYCSTTGIENTRIRADRSSMKWMKLLDVASQSLVVVSERRRTESTDARTREGAGEMLRMRRDTFHRVGYRALLVFQNRLYQWSLMVRLKPGAVMPPRSR